MSEALRTIILPHWKKDSGIDELIEMLDHRKDACWDQDTLRYRADFLKKAEYDLVITEAAKCQNDFSYAARNFFKIVTKQSEDTPFSLWESQELVLERMYEIKAKGKPQKLMVIKARQLGLCLDPDTKVLTADLRWVRIDDIQPDQELVGVDEMPLGEYVRQQRQLHTCTVMACREVNEEAYRLTMDNGEVLIATGPHRFLCKRRSGSGGVWRCVNHSDNGYRTSSPIVVGDEIRRITTPWDERQTFEDGWFGGLLDGEGSARKKKRAGAEVGISQVAGPVLERARRYLSSEGYDFREEVDRRKPGETSKFGSQPVHKFVLGRMPEIFRLLGKTRPVRFIGKRWWEGKRLPKNRNEEDSWSKVIAVESVGPRRMIDIQTDSGTFIANGFVSHNSTLVESLIAWRVMFFPNTSALVVADSRPNSAELFAKLLHVYDHLPWWLKPMLDRRKEEDLLKFDNPDHEARFKYPGLHSYVAVQPASSTQGVGQSRTLNAAHLSEYPSWDEQKAKEIIQEDIGNALAQNEDTFAFLEGTAKGVGKFSHKFWKRMVSLGDKASWVPIFLPWFFEKSRFLPPPGGWRPMQRLHDMRDRVKRDWVRCPSCGVYKEMAWGGVCLENTICWSCNKARLQPVVLTDAQLFWMNDQWDNNAFDSESKKILLQEMPVTCEEAFQLSGVQVFPQECLEFIEKSLDKFAFLHGTMDSKGVYHAMVGPKNNRRCCVAGCPRDHQYEEHHLKVWEVPIPGANYVIGADVAEGLGGDADYSVAWVNRVGAFNTPDYHVATYRSNEIDPIQFGDLLNALGRWYNEALIALEVNKFDACLYRVRSFHMYPNNFRWKIPDATNPLTNRWGFYTNAKSKPRLWQTAVLFLKQRLWVIRDESFYEEALTFQKVSAEDRGAEAELGQNDDCVMAGMICLYCSHDADYNEDSVNGSMGPKMIGNGSDDSWEMSCDACGMTWMASAPDKYRRCPNTKAGPEKNKVCGSVALRGRNIMPGPTAPSVDLGVELNSPWAGETPVPTYDSL